MKKLFVLISFGLFLANSSFGQFTNNCAFYTSVGTTTSGSSGIGPAGCNNFPGMVPTGVPVAWTGTGCAGFITSTVVGPPVTCMTLTYSSVNTNDFGTITTDTGGTLTLSGTNVGINGNVIGPYACSGSYGTVLLQVCSDIPFSSVTLTNTGCTSGWVINCSDQTDCIGSGCTVPCLITNFTANISACVPPNSYSTTGVVEFTDPPTTGQLIIEDCNGNQDVYNAPFTSPQNYTITGQNADGLPCDVTAYFSDDVACTQTINYNAPTCLCNMDMFNVNIGLCDQLTDTYCMTGDMQFTSPPAGGTLIVEVNNGSNIYDTIINPAFISGQTFSICGIPSDGSPSTITVYFSNDPGCQSIINYTAPTSCACSADIGTFNVNMTGSSTNNYVLCFGDGIDITTNNDWTGPGEMFNPPGPPYNPGVSWLIYSCPPTVGLIPQAGVNISTDPCFLGVATDNDLNDINNGGSWFDAFPPGTFTNNTVYFVPLTFYDQLGLTYSYVNGTIPCYDMGPYYDVQYLPQFSFSFTDDCLAGTADITVNGGLPAVDGSLFTASNLMPATASFVNTTTTDGGTIQISGLQGGDMWSFDVQDANGCPYTVSGGPFPPLEDPGFNYPQTSWCVTEPPMNPTITGVGGGTFTSAPAGLTINLASGQITPGTSAVGSYQVTYTTPGACFDDSTITVNITNGPIPDAGNDAAICAGESVTLNGSGIGTPSWAPAGTLSDPNIFNPIATPAVTTTYTLTIDVGGCIGTDDMTVFVINSTPIATSPDTSICDGACATISVAGGDYFVWDPDPDIIDSSLTVQTVCPVTTTTYNVTSYTVGPNMVPNGDFEAGNAGFTSSYNFMNPTNTGAGQFNVIPNPQTFNGAFTACSDHTSGAGNMMVVNGATTPGVSVWCTTIPVTPNTDYNFSTWITSVYASNPAILQFYINGNPLGSPFTPAAPNCNWQEFAEVWNSGANTTANICIVNQATASIGNDFALDDISFTTLCEQIDQVIVTVNPIPIVDAGPDQIICDGVNATLTAINPNGANLAWDNGVTDGVAFTPAVGSLTYTVTADLLGCIASDSAIVTVNPLPIVGAGPDQTICIGDPVTLNGTGATNYVWDNGVTDGVAFNPVATNTYTVTGTDVNNCVNTDQVIVNVNPLDDPTFSYIPGLTYCQTAADPVTNITGLTGGTFSYVVASGGPTLSINPATGDIVLATSDIGAYDITYNTAGALGSLCPQTFTLTLVITGAPVADFTLGTYCLNDIDPLPTYMNGGSGGTFSSNPAGLIIDPNSGLVDLDASTPGVYTVTNDIAVAGCPTATFNDDITIFELPDATISGTASICVGDPLPDVTIDITAGIPNWDITYNFDGTPVTVNTAGTPFTIAGAAVGTYDLVSITDGNGCSNTIAGQVVISEFPTPTVDPLLDQSICHGDVLLIQNFTSNPGGANFAWTNTTGNDLGFGLNGTGQIGSFTGDNTSITPSQVTVEVIPTSVDGCVGPPESFLVTVNPLPQVSFTGTPLSGCEPLTVQFDNLTQPNGNYCLWNFGNGNQVLGCGTVYNTYNAGDYDVTLTVTTAEGCTAADTYVNYVSVYPRPQADFTFLPQEIDVTDPVVDFYNNSTDAVSYTWDFGDNTPISTFIEGAHLYPNEPGEYLVTLTAYDANALCPDIHQALIVVDDIIIFYVPNVFTPDGDEFNENFTPIFTSGFDKFDYHLMIFNRWGEVIFESYDASKGWNGHYGDGGLVQDGVYIWQIEFKETMSDRHHTHRGHVTVLK